VAIIGFDNRVEIAGHLRPPLSTVALPPGALALPANFRAVSAVIGGSAPDEARLNAVTTPALEPWHQLVTGMNATLFTATPLEFSALQAEGTNR
jgi:hypothetical protein